MKIKKVEVSQYRSCVHTMFEVNPHLSALIGPNGSGKTNMLSAIRLLSNLGRFRRITRLGDEFESSAEIKTWFDWNGKTIIHSAKLNLVTNELNQDEIHSTLETWYLFEVTGNKKRLNIPLWALTDFFGPTGRFSSRKSNQYGFSLLNYFKQYNLGEVGLEIFSDIIDYISRITYYSASQFTNPSLCPTSFEVESDDDRRVGISIRGHKKLLYDIYQECNESQSSYSEFIGLIGPNGVNLIDEIKFDEIETSTSNYSVRTGGIVVQKNRVNKLVVPKFLVGNNWLSPNQLSEGTFKTIALIFYLVTDKSSLLMIEEPEVCVHHGLLNSIVELIKAYSNDKQIIISTHSDAVLDRLEIESVFTVTRNHGDGTRIKNLTKRLERIELTALKDYLKDEGSLGEYWRHGGIEQ